MSPLRRGVSKNLNHCHCEEPQGDEAISETCYNAGGWRLLRFARNDNVTAISKIHFIQAFETACPLPAAFTRNTLKKLIL
jgi:hypothetical protein